jgi:hypothetical protein
MGHPAFVTGRKRQVFETSRLEQLRVQKKDIEADWALHMQGVHVDQ